MPALSFRFKLLLAMVLVVVGVSAVTLLVTQRRVQANYERMFRDQFERQIAFFIALQEARLGAVKEQCLRFCGSVRLIAAMNEPEVDAPDLYQIAENELRDVLGELSGERVLSTTRDSPRLRATFFRFIDAQGELLLPPRAPRPVGTPGRHRVEQQLALIRQALTSSETQQVGYLSLLREPDTTDSSRARHLDAGQLAEKMTENDQLTLQEIIVTKVIDPATERTLGALAVGFPMPDLVPHSKLNNLARSAGAENLTVRLQSGILLEDRLYANPSVMPEAHGELAAREVIEHTRATQQPRDDFPATILNEPYRVFYDLLNRDSAFPPAYQVCLYPMTEALNEQQALRTKILGTGAAALLAALLLSLVISHGLSVPLRELVGGTREIQRGNYQVKVPVRTRDEIGWLASSFNDMADGLAQKEKYRTVLNMVADEKIAQQLISGGIALGGELRDVSILFCDIRGFTALTQNMPPGEVIAMLNEHMTALTRAVKQHNGVLDKFVGDLLMAIFGAPVSHENDALDAARCALGLLRERERLNENSRYQLEIGIGIATGNVVAGCMGSTERMNYTVLGERVNLASRLCDRAGPGEVWIDPTTKERLEGAIVIDSPTVVQLKGFAASVDAYRLLEVRT
jgi:class 3 adenylate cyclase